MLEHLSFVIEMDAPNLLASLKDARREIVLSAPDIQAVILLVEVGHEAKSIGFWLIVPA